jgi:hypothetical protein
MRFICAQPANLYYAWQVEVMLNNFIFMGINPNDIDIICRIENTVPEEWSKLANNYAARFFFYTDTRKTNHYISSVRPNILKQHFKNHPYLKDEAILYYDCDIVLSQPIDWKQFEGDDIWYGSDTKWYISYDYIISKGQDVFDKMVEVIDIDPQLVIDNNNNSVGAQYILKGADEAFWDQIERDSERLYKEVTLLNQQKVKADPSHHPLQIWCADMWALLWNVWKRGHKTQCHPDLEFSWATSKEEDYYKYKIMHNAGVTASNKDLFYKAAYMHKLPYNLNLKIRDKTASKQYYDWIKKVEKVTVL